jgi:hypothetical protein
MPNVPNMTGESDMSSIANPVTSFGVDALGDSPEGARQHQK